MRSRWMVCLTCSLSFLLAPLTKADTQVRVGQDQMLGLADLLAGEFMGQQFVLEAGTVFLVEDGGQFGPVPYVPSQSLDFNRSKIVVGAGGVFASVLGVTESSVYQAEVEVLLGGVIQDGLNMGGGSSLLVDGGEVGRGLSFAGTEILMRSGSIGGGLYAATNARFTMEDGMVGGSVGATGNAQFTVYAGDILSDFRLSGGATLTLQAGRILAGR